MLPLAVVPPLAPCTVLHLQQVLLSPSLLLAAYVKFVAAQLQPDGAHRLHAQAAPAWLLLAAVPWHQHPDGKSWLQVTLLQAGIAARTVTAQLLAVPAAVAVGLAAAGAVADAVEAEQLTQQAAQQMPVHCMAQPDQVQL